MKAKLLAMMQSGKPPLNEEILLYTGNAWWLGNCYIYKPIVYGEDMILLDDGTGLDHLVEETDRWLVLPKD